MDVRFCSPQVPGRWPSHERSGRAREARPELTVSVRVQKVRQGQVLTRDFLDGGDESGWIGYEWCMSRRHDLDLADMGGCDHLVLKSRADHLVAGRPDIDLVDSAEASCGQMDRCGERRQRLVDHRCRDRLLNTGVSIIRKERTTCGRFDRRQSRLFLDLEMRTNLAAAIVRREIQEGLAVLRNKGSDEDQGFDFRWFGLGDVREGDAPETMADEHDRALFATERTEHGRAVQIEGHLSGSLRRSCPTRKIDVQHPVSVSLQLARDPVPNLRGFPSPMDQSNRRLVGREGRLSDGN